jgi:hypothetical protein
MLMHLAADPRPEHDRLPGRMSYSRSSALERRDGMDDSLGFLEIADR